MALNSLFVVGSTVDRLPRNTVVTGTLRAGLKDRG